MKNVIAKCRGFTLLEVLIAVVVLSIGLLGIASLQAFGQRNNHSAYLRSQATALAYDMIDRMRANNAGVTGNDYNAIDTTATTYTDPGCAGGTICSPAQMAQYDMYDWQQKLKDPTSGLPSGNGTVVGAGAGSVFTVTVMWNDDRNAAPGLACGTNNLKCFTVSSQL